MKNGLEPDLAILLAVAATGILALSVNLFTSGSFRDGVRCLQRYPELWGWLALLAVCYFCFGAIQSLFLNEWQVRPQELLVWPPFVLLDPVVAASHSWLPALESLAGLFNLTTVSFPLSGLAALAFLVNWNGCQTKVIRASKQRFPHWWMVTYLGVLMCAIAALCKPFFSLCIYWLNNFFGGALLLRAGAVLDTLSFQFEYLFGLVIQMYLLLCVLVWVRGLHADSVRTLDMALKRTIYAGKWAALILALSLSSIQLPLLASYFWAPGWSTASVVQYVQQTVRPSLAVIIVLFCSMQLNLTFHNETLRQAFLDHVEFIRNAWSRILWFLTVAGIVLFVVCWAGEIVRNGFPQYSTPNLLASLASMLGRTFFSAWFLATWVCLYRKCQKIEKEIPF